MTALSKFIMTKQIKKIALSVILLTGLILLVFIGCRKIAIEKKVSYSIDQTKEWYYRFFRKSPEYVNSKTKRYPDWQNGFKQTFGPFEIMEYPLKSNDRIIPITNAGDPNGEKVRTVHATFDRLLIGQKNDGELQAKVVSYIPDAPYLKSHNYDASGNQITKIDPDYAGLVLISEWNGDYVSGYRFKNGKPVAKVTRRQRQPKIDRPTSDGIRLPASQKKEILTVTKPSGTGTGNRVDLAPGCVITYTDYYRCYSIGHMEGDVYVEDMYEEVFIGSGDFEYSSECDDNDDPPELDWCEIFFCYDEGGGGGFNPGVPCNTSNVSYSINDGATPSLTLNYCYWGLTYPESVDISISACNDGVKWNAVVTSIVGNYSVQTRLLPGITEVTGPGGNTSSSNYCAQMTELMQLGVCTGSWYMIEAVRKHEAVHASHFLQSLSTSMAATKTAIEALSVPFTSQDEVSAVAAIKSLSSYSNLAAGAYAKWLAQSTIDISGDHAPGGPTQAAELNVVVPMKVSICTFSKTQVLWPACSICP